MSEQLETWIDAAIGETREVLVRQGRPIALRIARWSDEGRRARWGEAYCARVTMIDRRRRGAFIDLGLKQDQGFLPLDSEGRVRLRDKKPVDLREGQGIIVSVSREGARSKNPVVELLETGHDGEAPHRVAQHASDEHLLLTRPTEVEVRGKIDALIEDMLSRTAPIAGGGVLTIEPTAALVSIDVDAGARAGSGDPERFALDLNLAAAQEAAHQVRLRNLGGVIALDFVSMRAKAHRAQLEQAVRAAFADDPWGVQFGELSRFGVFELARQQHYQPLHEQMRDADGGLSAETLALMALRAIEREARASTGRQIACTVSDAVKAWLDGAEFDWRGRLGERIGLRWTLDGAPKGANWPREKIDARAL